MPRIPIVNSNDEIIGHKEKAAVLPGELRRIAALWLTNSKGEILIAQRALTKKHYPGRWGFAVTGAVEEGESYESTIRREIVEELGIHNLEITLGPKFLTTPMDGARFFCQYFFAVKDIAPEEFHLEPHEVAMVRWFTHADLLAELTAHPEMFISSPGSWRTWLEDHTPF